MFTVRPATPADWAAVRAVRLAALAEAPHAFGSTLARESEFDDAEWQRRVAPGNWVLAHAGDEVVGVAAGVAEDDRDVDERHLVAMWVVPQHRGRGVAVLLVAGVARWATACGASHLSLWVADGNEAARHAYLRIGFTATGERQPLPSNPDVSEERMLLTIERPPG